MRSDRTPWPWVRASADYGIPTSVRCDHGMGTRANTYVQIAGLAHQGGRNGLAMSRGPQLTNLRAPGVYRCDRMKGKTIISQGRADGAVDPRALASVVTALSRRLDLE